MSERGYALVTSIFLGACMVLFLFWVQGRQIAVRVDPLQAQFNEQVKVLTLMMEGDHVSDDERMTALETRIRELEARPAERVVIREESRPVPVFARGKAMGR